MERNDYIQIPENEYEIGLNTFCQLAGLSKFEYNYSLDRNLAYFKQINNHTLQINTNLSNVQQISNNILYFYYSLDDNQKRMLTNPDYWWEEIVIAIKFDIDENIYDRLVCDEIRQNIKIILQNVKKQININSIQYFFNKQKFIEFIE